MKNKKNKIMNVYKFIQSYIDSGYLNINIFSGFSSIVFFLEGDKYLNYLLIKTNVENQNKKIIQNIIRRIKKIKTIEIEEQYEHPLDEELTILLWCLHKLDYEIEDSLLADVKNLWHARKMENYIFSLRLPK